MHNNLLCFKARYVFDVFITNGIEVLPWLGNLPNLNPIENV